ncbi:hypothetical protein A2U01_0009749 [Trifolium medium]|uniref:Uncharacterized protein n=1 Tax=Trifolium medium TaxID=97028 RepID=A0A392MMW7_9FABA|nr:hypothetical protein [Trifolium medium]
MVLNSVQPVISGLAAHGWGYFTKPIGIKRSKVHLGIFEGEPYEEYRDDGMVHDAPFFMRLRQSRNLKILFFMQASQA